MSSAAAVIGALRVNAKWYAVVDAEAVLMPIPQLPVPTTKKQTIKFSPANFQKNVKSMLYHIENSKTRGQTV